MGAQWKESFIARSMRKVSFSHVIYTFMQHWFYLFNIHSINNYLSNTTFQTWRQLLKWCSNLSLLSNASVSKEMTEWLEGWTVIFLSFWPDVPIISNLVPRFLFWNQNFLSSTFCTFTVGPANKNCILSTSIQNLQLQREFGLYTRNGLHPHPGKLSSTTLLNGHRAHDCTYMVERKRNPETIWTLEILSSRN